MLRSRIEIAIYISYICCKGDWPVAPTVNSIFSWRFDTFFNLASIRLSPQRALARETSPCQLSLAIDHHPRSILPEGKPFQGSL